MALVVNETMENGSQSRENSDKIECWKYKPIEKEIFHVHTRRCKHAEEIPDEEYIKKAVNLGAKRIVFTDHAPFPDNPFGNRMSIEELPEYISTINELRESYKAEIEILCGLEVEYLPSFSKYICELKETKGIDLLILGQHIYELPDKPMEWSFSLDDRSQEHIYMAKAMIDGIKTGCFDVVAHPDRIFRRINTWTEECAYYAHEIIDTAICNFVSLERNYSSMQRKNQYRKEFWYSVADEMIITDGIDAHCIKDVVTWVEHNKEW